MEPGYVKVNIINHDYFEHNYQILQAIYFIKCDCKNNISIRARPMNVESLQNHLEIGVKPLRSKLDGHHAESRLHLLMHDR